MFSIANRPIGAGQRPYLIAEMSGNHNQSLDRALEIVDAAADSGADAVKLQTYTADTMTLDLSGAGLRDRRSEEPVGRPPALRSLPGGAYALGMARADHGARQRARDALLLARRSTTRRSISSRRSTCPAYKIASFENTDLPLIRKVAATGKPMIISTGMATVAEIDEAVATARARRRRRDRAAEMHQHLSGDAREQQSRDHPQPARDLRLRGRPVRPHDGLRRRRGRGRARRDA